MHGKFSYATLFPKEHGIFPGECVYIHDPLGLNVLKKGCSRYCNQTVKVNTNYRTKAQKYLLGDFILALHKSVRLIPKPPNPSPSAPL